jgi:magnesium transporter
MLRGWFQRRSQKAGLPPGSMVYVGDKNPEEPLITIIDYNETEFHEIETEKAEDTYPFRDTKNVSWINVARISDINTVEKIGSYYGVHPLVLEDTLAQGQRPKFEDLENYLFVIVNMISYDPDAGGIKTEQVSIVFCRTFLITFQEIEGDVFDTVRDRLRTGKGRIRKLGPDYLAYAILDAIVDNYFIILEGLGEKLDDIEEDILDHPGRNTLQDIHTLRRDLLYLRKSVWPLREVIDRLQRDESGLVQDSTRLYLRDLYDHTIQVIDTVETFRDMLAGILDTYLSSISNRLNEVMKVLTVISTIFIPLTFLVGAYGMNFEHMPELHTRWGYPVLWGVMIAIALGMLLFFKRRKWF